jgi:hypothetical protein
MTGIHEDLCRMYWVYHITSHATPDVSRFLSFILHGSLRCRGVPGSLLPEAARSFSYKYLVLPPCPSDFPRSDIAHYSYQTRCI